MNEREQFFEMGRLRRAIQQAYKSPENDEAFADVFRRASLFLTDAELAPIGEVERSTIGRWREGESLPHPLIRLTIYERLIGPLTVRGWKVNDAFTDAAIQELARERDEKA